MEIVGLKQKVDDDVNKLIFKFVGVKPQPLAELLKSVIREYVLIFGDEDEFDSSYFLVCRRRCHRCDEQLKDDEIKAHYGERYWAQIKHFKICYGCFLELMFVTKQ
jgi:hypothetical protein